MIRTGFDFKIAANTYNEASEIAKTYISNFLGISLEAVDDSVDIEFKVSLPKADSIGEVTQTMDSGQLIVHVFGSVKRSMARPFGH